ADAAQRGPDIEGAPAGAMIRNLNFVWYICPAPPAAFNCPFSIFNSQFSIYSTRYLLPAAFISPLPL
ncbi:MAG: hypothetical protein ACP5G8_03740, partial [Athalassotoga sp.]